MDSNKCSNCGRTAPGDYRALIKTFERDRTHLLPMLHALQDDIGYLPSVVMEEVAVHLEIPVSEVYGTATFYTLYTREPLGKYVIRLCDSPPCHIEGSKKIKKAIQDHLGVEAGGTTRDGAFTFELVSCFGLCGVAPAIMVNDDVYGNLTPEAIPGILSKYREGGK